MTHKERIIKALNHQEPDRIPLDFFSTPYSGMHIEAYRRFLTLRNIDYGPLEVFNLVQKLPLVNETTLMLLDIDTRGLFPCFPFKKEFAVTRTEQAFFFEDYLHIEWSAPFAQTSSAKIMRYPFAKIDSVEEIDQFDWPDMQDKGIYERIESGIVNLKGKDYVGIVLNPLLWGFTKIGGQLMGLERFYSDLVADSKLVWALIDKIIELKMEYIKNLSEKIPHSVDIIVEVEDLATEEGLRIPYEQYKTFLKPRQKEYYAFIKRCFPDSFLLLHSCGSVRKIIPDMVELGVDILNPIQYRAKDMKTDQLKKDFGDSISFWGGACDVREFLPSAKPGEIEYEIRKNIDNLAPGGGFVFALTHNIPRNVPPENIEAVFSAFSKYAKY